MGINGENETKERVNRCRFTYATRKRRLQKGIPRMNSPMEYTCKKREREEEVLILKERRY